jgi:hypothetical protein
MSKAVNTGISKTVVVSAQGYNWGIGSFSTVSSDVVHFGWAIVKVSYLLLFA